MVYHGNSSMAYHGNSSMAYHGNPSMACVEQSNNFWSSFVKFRGFHKFLQYERASNSIVKTLSSTFLLI